MISQYSKGINQIFRKKYQHKRISIYVKDGFVEADSTSFDFFKESIRMIFRRGYEGYEWDHIVPLNQAINTRELFLLTSQCNLQLITKEENRKKSDKPTTEGVDLCSKLLNRKWICNPSKVRKGLQLPIYLTIFK